MNVPRLNRKALWHGMSSLISNAWSAIYIVALDGLRNLDTVTLTPMLYGTVSSDGALSSDISDKPLSHAIILDTAEDINTKLAVVCNECGTGLEVTEVREVPEEAVILEIGPCKNCKSKSFEEGYYQTDRMGY